MRWLIIDVARGLEEIAPEEREQSRALWSSGAAAVRARSSGGGILAPLLCARFSDLGLELSDETEHSSCARLSDLGLVPSDETEHSIVVLD